MSLSPMLQRVLTAAGQSMDAHEHYIDELRKQWESESGDFERKLLLILKAAVTKCQVDKEFSNLSQFIGTCLGYLGASFDDGPALVDAVLTWLVASSDSEEKSERERICTLIHAVLAKIRDFDIASGDKVIDALLERTRDSVSAVRIAAVDALGALPASLRYEELQWEEHIKLSSLLQKVRASACKALVSVGVTPQTWAVLIDSAQNSDHPDVRRTAFACLSSVAETASMPAFEAASLRNLLRRGLTDEVPATRQAAHSFVCDLQRVSNPMQEHVAGVCCSADAPGARDEPNVRAAAQLVLLLDSMDASEDLETAQLVVEACFAEGSPGPMAFAQTGLQHNLSLRPGTLLSASAAIFWDCICTFLSDGASHHGTEAACALGAAAAVKGAGAMRHLDALDIICSEPLGLLRMVAEHVKAPDPQCVAACRLMAAARTCVHFGDSAARAEAEALCSELVTLTFTLRKGASGRWEVMQNGGDGSWEQSVVQLAFASAAPAQAADLLLSQMCAAQNDLDYAPPAPSAEVSDELAAAMAQLGVAGHSPPPAGVDPSMPPLCYFALLRALLRQLPPSTRLPAACLTMLDNAVSVYAVPAATNVDARKGMEQQQGLAVQCVGLYTLHLLMLRQRREDVCDLATDAGTLIGILRVLVAAGSTQPLAAQTAAVTALGDLCLVLSPADVDARSVAGPAQADGYVAELLKLNTVDLMVNRLWWAWEKVMKGPLARQHVDFQEGAPALQEMVQAISKALGRLALKLAAPMSDNAVLNDLEGVRIIENLLPAVFLDNGTSESAQKRVAWFSTFLSEFAALIAGGRISAYALVPAARRAWALDDDKVDIEAFVALVRDRMLLAHAGPEEDEEAGSEVEGDVDANARPAQAPQLPWLYDLQLLLHTEVANYFKHPDEAPYLCALLDLSLALPSHLLSVEQLRRLVHHARFTLAAFETFPGKVLTKATDALEELKRCYKEAREASEPADGVAEWGEWAEDVGRLSAVIAIALPPSVRRKVSKSRASGSRKPRPSVSTSCSTVSVDGVSIGGSVADGALADIVNVASRDSDHVGVRSSPIAVKVLPRRAARRTQPMLEGHISDGAE